MRVINGALSKIAMAILKERYLLRNKEGKATETVREMFFRVARAVAVNESAEWEQKFFQLMSSLRFLPNSPTLMNAGKKQGQLSACFVLPVEDSVEKIFETVKLAAKIHQTGGGTGFSFSKLRPKGSPVSRVPGVASGPVSFAKIFDATTEAVKQGGARRGANMAVLRVDHPDILEFINAKRDFKSFQNFNLSVGITRAFVSALVHRQKFALVDPRTNRITARGDAREIFNLIAQAAWECGDPGLIFLDRINLFNPTPRLGQIESTNPCGEEPLLPFESCNLGSLNLAAYVSREQVDWGTLAQDVTTATRFLDNVIDVNNYPSRECEKWARENRKIGLGVMGFADALLRLRINYNSPKAVEFAEKVMSFIDNHAKAASVELAKKRGAFLNWKNSLWDQLGYPKMRNATVTTVAPTGTISLIAGVSSGIEPIYGEIVRRQMLDGKVFEIVHPDVKKSKYRKVWCPAEQVEIKAHINVQAAFQRYSDSGVSKTINLPKDSTVKDVKEAFLLAYKKGCKGITIYRSGSRPKQVLQTKRVCLDCSVCLG